MNDTNDRNETKENRFANLYIFTVMLNNAEAIAMSIGTLGELKPLVYTSEKDITTLREEVQRLVNTHKVQMNLLKYELVERVETFVPISNTVH